ncbi:MAG TPA: DUF2007 domain-containing protein [Tepidisphaeraceae bacterium]|jgi:hypothetical protein|nr:DUF2007 domain-containing protein [Tepidisphaeraceae bacterium]
MKQIYSARDEVDAEMVKNALADADIESVVQSGGLSAVLGAIPVTEGSLPSVWVRDEDVDRATKALAEFQNPPKQEGVPWKCPKCGEIIDPQFSACWNCGTAHPDSSLPTE